MASEMEINQVALPILLENAKTYMTLSFGAIGVSVAFRERILGIVPGHPVGLIVVVSWAAYFLCVALSIIYQTAIAVYFANLPSDESFAGGFFDKFGFYPALLYIGMIAAFALGSLLLFSSIVRQLLFRRPMTQSPGSID